MRLVWRMQCPHVVPLLLNQVGLVIGLLGSILLAFSGRLGVISKNGSIILTGLDPIASADDTSNAFCSRMGEIALSLRMDGMLVVSFFLQFIATLSQP